MSADRFDILVLRDRKGRRVGEPFPNTEAGKRQAEAEAERLGLNRMTYESSKEPQA